MARLRRAGRPMLPSGITSSRWRAVAGMRHDAAACTAVRSAEAAVTVQTPPATAAPAMTVGERRGGAHRDDDGGEPPQRDQRGPHPAAGHQLVGAEAGRRERDRDRARRRCRRRGARRRAPACRRLGRWRWGWRSRAGSDLGSSFRPQHERGGDARRRRGGWWRPRPARAAPRRCGTRTAASTGMLGANGRETLSATARQTCRPTIRPERAAEQRARRR